jgi:hypothetical protein
MLIFVLPFFFKKIVLLNYGILLFLVVHCVLYICIAAKRTNSCISHLYKLGA